MLHNVCLCVCTSIIEPSQIEVMVVRGRPDGVQGLRLKWFILRRSAVDADAPSGSFWDTFIGCLKTRMTSGKWRSDIKVNTITVVKSGSAK